MVNKKTVIVVGAGASKEFGLPVGEELITEVKKLLRIRTGYYGLSEQKLLYAFKVFGSSYPGAHNLDKMIDASRKIVKALPHAISIDNLIDEHRGDKELEKCGKLAITLAILNAERASTIYCEPHDGLNLNFEKSKETWLNSLTQIIKQNCEFEELSERVSNITLIVFNYDRCIEHYLFYAFQHAYGVSEAEVKNLLKELKIFHPYGKIGDLPWEEEKDSIPFGSEPNSKELVELSKNLRTFTEGTDSKESEISLIREEVIGADTTLFLGFAYHKLNLELLRTQGVEHSSPHSKFYFGTSLGFSDANTDSIKEDLTKLAGVSPLNINIRNDLTCYSLFKEYWRLLLISNI